VNQISLKLNLFDGFRDEAKISWGKELFISYNYTKNVKIYK